MPLSITATFVDVAHPRQVTTAMGFVDDVEFYLDEDTKVIHVRSASRLGQSDLGVNRKRIETIRTEFELNSNSIG